MNSTALFRRTILYLCAAIILMGGTRVRGLRVELEGFVPPDISRGTVVYEFTRISEILAPGRDIGKEPLTITYFTQRGVGEQPYSLPEWGGGGAIGTRQIVVALDAEPLLYYNILRTTIHELVHIAINRICTTTVVPRWFHEGVAMALSGDVTQSETVIISRAILTGSLIPLSSIDSVNSFGQFRAQLAYAQSHQAVLFLINTYGMGVLSEILIEANRRGDFWSGVRAVLELSQREIESMAREYLIRRYRLAFFFADTYLLWIAVTLLLLVAYLLTKIRNARKAALMAQQEEGEEQTIPE